MTGQTVGQSQISTGMEGVEVHYTDTPDPNRPPIVIQPGQDRAALHHRIEWGPARGPEMPSDIESASPQPPQPPGDIGPPPARPPPAAPAAAALARDLDAQVRRDAAAHLRHARMEADEQPFDHGPVPDAAAIAAALGPPGRGRRHGVRRRARRRRRRIIVRPARYVVDVLPVYPDNPPPGRRLNPRLIGWYSQQSFDPPDYEQDEMSKLYPWLFGPQGLYGGMVIPKCEYPCKWVDGACECP